MSVPDNIRLSKDRDTGEQIAEATTIGNACNFVVELPQNYRTPGKQSTVSGGQKQRICISKATLAKSPIPGLDEATALDTESKQLVQQSLEVFR
jgi:ABC-type multidrug transport system fused ATPase/permease subunit